MLSKKRTPKTPLKSPIYQTVEGQEIPPQTIATPPIPNMPQYKKLLQSPTTMNNHLRPFCTGYTQEENIDKSVVRFLKRQTQKTL